MNQKLSASTSLLLLIPPLMWASNAVVGRAVADMVPPLTLNFIRWVIALIILLPLGFRVFAKGSAIWSQWRRYSMLGLLGIGLFNSMQYLALHTSTPINVTLVLASMPVWMLIIGRMFYGVGIKQSQLLGSLLSIAGVAVVLSQGQWQQLLALQFVLGDLIMVVATIIWAFYSWQLTMVPADAPERSHWASFLLAQVFYGVAWSGLISAIEWEVSDAHIDWSWPLVAAIVYIAIGPAVIAFRCWGAGVQRVGPTLAGFFNNLTPLFAAILSLLLLGERPHIFHAVAFALIVSGIVFSSRASKA